MKTSSPLITDTQSLTSAKSRKLRRKMHSAYVKIASAKKELSTLNA